ncbi:MarR family winged helix-turn-helix transcriptional regulator [Microbacterium pullorum]|uniref:MarR family winged helix-turn-helix transcriptional regulator n=1 Tax=Microbacterium pullorum TaxID=2762236 RepID=UPI003851173A
MRRLWAPTTSGRAAHGSEPGVDLSTVLVVHAIGASGGLSVADVAAQLGVAPATASRLCDKAVTSGYVSKAPAVDGPRRLTLTLTPAGTALRAEAAAFRARYLASLLDGWAEAGSMRSRCCSVGLRHPSSPTRPSVRPGPRARETPTKENDEHHRPRRHRPHRSTARRRAAQPRPCPDTAGAGSRESGGRL